MKLRKALSFVLAVAIAASSATFAANAVTTDKGSVSAGNYSNAGYLENYASSAYNESGLGSTYSASSTTWKTWSPEASSVKVKLYATGSDSESGAKVLGTHAMTKNSSTGVWSLNLSGDYKNVYYTYLVNVNGSENETQDVYSKATGVNGARSMVVDLSSTNPEGWNEDKHILFNSAAEAVVWEVHVRDFSASDTSGVSEENKGKYLAFAEGGTTLSSDSSVSTGIDYLVEQGINCVQLLPVYDFETVNETIQSSSTNRNWGYDPKNYNVPEGSYSSNPYDGNVRITEFKQMIQALHDRGISVVMDVVYNHTYSTNSCFQNTVPNYYYRMTSGSTFSNGSGCGNETASDKLMYRKYMIESLKYWASEYHIDGFRFDLMGIHDVDTMNAARSALDGLYADGSGKKILMYGEPWTGGSVAISNGCTSSQISNLDPRVGMFCDRYRDAIKGGTDDATTGFIQGNNEKTSTVATGVSGKCFGAKAPSQTIAYADAHDNLILWDKILKSNGVANYNSTESYLKGQVQEVMGLLLTSQGVPFMVAGSEFCRTKQGDYNSYKSSDAVNCIDWSRVKTYADSAAYYKGLLAIRENYSPMHGSNFSTPNFVSQWGDVVGYTYSNGTSGEWGKVCVLVNSGSQAWSINLGSSGWVVVADGKKAGLTSLGNVDGNTYSVPSKSACVLVEKSTFNNLKPKSDAVSTVTIKHIDDKGTVLKTSQAKYRAGSTYHAIADSSILYDYDLIGTTGATSGKVEAGKTYNVTFTYSSTGVQSGYLKVNYVDKNGAKLKDSVSYHLRAGESYSVPAAEIMGYSLDTSKYPASSYGTFTGSDQTVTFVYNELSASSTVVHYYNSKNWGSIQLYSYTAGGKEPNGAWAKATTMTGEGNNWYKATVPASSAYVMFHPSTGEGQEPAQGSDGYVVAGGEVWIQNGSMKFNSTVVVSHIDAATGKKLSDDMVTSPVVTSGETYNTAPLSGRTDVIVPANANGNYAPGVVNVVYLYTSDVPPVTTPTTSNPVTVPTTSTPVTQPTTAGVYVLIGDTDLSGRITVVDATLIQQYLVMLSTLSEEALVAADTDKDTKVCIKDATNIQKYLLDFENYAYVGTYSGSEPTAPVTVPTTEPITQPVTQPTTATQPVGKSTATFTNSLFWGGTIYCYYWSDSNKSMTTWPGQAMTFSYKNDYGQDVYTFDVPSDATFVIFTNGGSQTVDIPFSGSAKYYATGTKDSMGHSEVKTW
ncbi:MAG: type I pullulanase [Ruminococcus sp.]|nr:type I pullulanase [Ruminococcus sp.]